SGTTASNQILNIDGGNPDSNFGTVRDLLTVTMSTAGLTTVAPGSTPDAGVVSSLDGNTNFSGIELITVTGAVAGANSLNAQGTNGNDTMAIQFVTASSENRIWVNDRAPVIFNNYQAVT